jgi:hypothetical protein
MQSVNYTAGLNGCFVNQDVRIFSAYRVMQCVNSYNCRLFRPSLYSFDGICREKACDLLVNLHVVMAVCNLNWELKIY